MTRDNTCDVVCPPERHIPVPPHELSQVFLSRLGEDDQQKYRELLKLMEAATQFEFLDIRRRIKRNFRLFSLGAAGEEYNSRLRRGLPKKLELLQREQRFVSDFLLLLKAAHYQLLTQAEWDMAVEEEFQLTMPVAVNWKHMDDALLTGYWSNHQDERRNLAEMLDRVLVFHRGVGVAKTAGLFLSEKVDLLVEYGITKPLSRLWNWIRRKSVDVATAEADKEPGEEEDWKKHKRRRVVPRRTLNRVLPDFLSVVKNVHRKVEIQEPTFKEMIILYRKADHRPKDPKGSRSSVALAKRNIFIKSFTDVPMADVELIFPDKKVFIKAVSKIQLAVTVVVALVGAMASLIGTNLDYAVIGSALMLILGRSAQVYTSLQQQRAEMTTQIAMMLYGKARDSQEGALFSVLDEMAAQYYKELIFTYSMLLTQNGHFSAEGFDEKCEQFLEDNFNLKIDFAIEDSLHRLQREGLIIFDENDGLPVAKDLDSAMAAIKDKWYNYFDGVPDDDESESFLRYTKFHKSSSLVAEAANFGASTLGAVKQGLRSGIKGVKNVFAGSRKQEDSGKTGLFQRMKTGMSRAREDAE